MLGEAITILLLLCIAAISFIRQKKVFFLQATIPLSFMPLATVLMHSFITKLAHTSVGFNRMVYIVYAIAAVLTLVCSVLVCFKLHKPHHRIIYTVTVVAFNALLGWLFLQANLI